MSSFLVRYLHYDQTTCWYGCRWSCLLEQQQQHDTTMWQHWRLPAKDSWTVRIQCFFFVEKTDILPFYFFLICPIVFTSNWSVFKPLWILCTPSWTALRIYRASSKSKRTSLRRKQILSKNLKILEFLVVGEFTCQYFLRKFIIHGEQSIRCPECLLMTRAPVGEAICC